MQCGQVWNAEAPEEEVLAMVVRVKLDTTMGSMVRQLIAPVAAVQEKEPFEAVSICSMKRMCSQSKSGLNVFVSDCGRHIEKIMCNSIVEEYSVIEVAFVQRCMLSLSQLLQCRT